MYLCDRPDVVLCSDNIAMQSHGTDGLLHVVPPVRSHHLSAGSTVYERICRHKAPVVEPSDGALFPVRS